MDCCCTPPLGRKNFGLKSIGLRSGKCSAGTIELRLPWGTDLERARSERIAAAVPGARVEERSPLDQVAALIAGAQFVVGVDTGLLHLAAALGVPLVAIFTGSRPGLTGPVGSGPIADTRALTERRRRSTP